MTQPKNPIRNQRRKAPSFAAESSPSSEHEQPDFCDTFSLSGEGLDRLRQALKVAGHQAHIAQSTGYGRHVEDALAEIEEAISDHLARINNALDDDKAEAEESDEAERARRVYFPRYEAV